MNDSTTIDPRRRMRELLAIPDRDRTDEQWDELNELEIRTAPGNRESDRSPEKRPNNAHLGRRPDRPQANKSPRPESRPPETWPDARPPEARTENQNRPRSRSHRRPKRPSTDVTGNS